VLDLVLTRDNKPEEILLIVEIAKDCEASPDYFNFLTTKAKIPDALKIVGAFAKAGAKAEDLNAYFDVFANLADKDAYLNFLVSRA